MPEFALYMPGVGGNFQFAIIAEGKEKWLIEAEDITARYRAGAMHYTIKDPMLGNGEMQLSVLPMFNAEGMLVKAIVKGADNKVELLWLYGGASGRKFSRGGDLGADPESSFYLKPENCRDNIIALEENNSFTIHYNQGRDSLAGVFPEKAAVRISDAEFLKSPSALWKAKKAENNILVGKLTEDLNEPHYFSIYNPGSRSRIRYDSLESIFEKAEKDRKEIAERIVVKTPDPYINTLGGVLAMAADAIWEAPSYLHGAVAWRMPLNGWRGPMPVIGWAGMTEPGYISPLMPHRNILHRLPARACLTRKQSWPGRRKKWVRRFLRVVILAADPERLINPITMI